MKELEIPVLFRNRVIDNLILFSFVTRIPDIIDLFQASAAIMRGGGVTWKI